MITKLTFCSNVGSTGYGPFKMPTELDIDKNGDLYVTNSGNNRIQNFNSDGEFLFTLGSKGSNKGQFFDRYSSVVS